MCGPNHDVQGAGGGAEEWSGRVHCSPRGGGAEPARSTSLRVAGREQQPLPLRSRRAELLPRVPHGRLDSGMARSLVALPLPPLTLLLLATSAQISPDYHYFGEQGEGDTWERQRLQNYQKGIRRPRV